MQLRPEQENMGMATITKLIAGIAGCGIILALGGCGQGQQAGTAEGDVPANAASTPVAGTDKAGAGAAGTSAAGPSLASAPTSFGQCASCHSLQPGKHGIGPSLAGVYGTRAGEVAGYAFSPALKAAGLTLDDATLDKWLAGPMQMVPGTKMTYAGMPDPAKRAELIAFLKTLK